MPALNSRPTSSSARPSVEQHVGLGRTCGWRVQDRRQVDGVGVAVEQRQAVEEERRRERAEQEVLDRGLLRQQAAAARHAGHQVQRQRQHLERDEHQQQVVRRSGRSACRRRRTAAAGRSRSARGRWWPGAGRPASRRRRPTTATIGLPTSTLRSAISSTAMTASTRIVPWMNSPAGSIGERAGERRVRCPSATAWSMVVPCSSATDDDRRRPARRA